MGGASSVRTPSGDEIRKASIRCIGFMAFIFASADVLVQSATAKEPFMKDFMHRRTFLKSTIATGAAVAGLGTSGAVHGILSSTGRAAREEKLRIGVIGVRNRGAANLAGMRGEHVVALCDVDAEHLAQAGAELPDARRFRDYREMIDADLDLDCVVISTPDHNHARRVHGRGRHVYCEGYLSTPSRRSTLANWDRSGIVTMGFVIHADNYRRVVELIRSGPSVIVEAHAWPGRLGARSSTPARRSRNGSTGTLARSAPETEFVRGSTPRTGGDTGTMVPALGDMGCHHRSAAVG